jgi:hypothetical protein
MLAAMAISARWTFAVVTMAMLAMTLACGRRDGRAARAPADANATADTNATATATINANANAEANAGASAHKDGASQPGWRVERVERRVVATLPAIAPIVDAYPDHDLFRVEAAVPRFSRLAPDGSVRWSVSWDGTFELGGNACDDDVTWIIGTVGSRLRVSPSIAYEVHDGGPQRVIVLARLDSRDGHLLGARFIDDASYWYSAVLPDDDGAFVAAGVMAADGLPPMRLRRYDLALELRGEASTVATSLRGMDLVDGGVCASLQVRETPEATPVRELWCLDRDLRTTRSRRTMEPDLLNVWMQGGEVVGRATSDTHALHVSLDGQPAMVVTPRCRLARWAPSHAFPVPCPAEPLAYPGTLIVDGRWYLMVDAAVDVDLAGTTVPLAPRSALIAELAAGGIARVSVHPGCTIAFPLEHAHVLLECDARYQVVALAP